VTEQSALKLRSLISGGLLSITFVRL